MIRVEGIEKEYILDLNEVEGNEHELLVVSKDKEGFKHLMWGIDMKTSDSFTAEAIGKDTLFVSIEPNLMCEEESFWLRNTNGDKYKVRIIPREKYVEDQSYIFDAYWITNDEDELLIKIESSVNGEPCTWECTHDGFPLDIDLVPDRGNGDATISIYPQCEAIDGVESFFEFTQDESEKIAKVRFKMNGRKIITIT